MKKLTLMILLLSSAAIGCKFIDSIRGGGSDGGTTGGSSGGSVTASSDPRADIVAAANKFIALKAFSAKMEGMGQTEIKSQVDYVAPDRYHVKYLGGTGAGMEMIFVGSQSFMKAAGGSWSKIPGDAKAIPTLRDSFTEDGLKSLTDAKFESEETVDGKAALVYSYKNVTPVGNYSFTSKIWIDKGSGLPLKVYVEYSNGMLKNMTVKYDTETPITIEPPLK